MRPEAKFSASIEVTGAKGSMLVKNPIAPQYGNAIELTVGGDTTTETFDKRPTYSFQLDAFLEAAESGASLYTDAEDAVKQMRVIDRCYEAAGLKLRGL